MISSARRWAFAEGPVRHEDLLRPSFLKCLRAISHISPAPITSICRRPRSPKILRASSTAMPLMETGSYPILVSVRTRFAT